MLEGIGQTVCRALVSTANKKGLVPFLLELKKAQVEILATGSTAQLCRDHGIEVINVSDYTGFPEILDGRVKTLHPRIHAGILSRRDQDQSTLDQHQIGLIDLVIVNLYPFEETTAATNCTLNQAIEQIDIGGPTLLRAAAKNHHYVTAVVDPADYDCVVQQIRTIGNTQLELRRSLAAKVFRHTAQYDAVVAEYLQPDAPPSLLSFKHIQPLRYGENPHQTAFVVQNVGASSSLAAAEPLQGKPLSYNNLQDADAALRCVQRFPLEQPLCAIIKHATPCGMATAKTLSEAYTKALQSDSVSAFGGIVAFNRAVDGVTAEAMSGQFIEVVLAPGFTDEALKIFSKKKQCRLLVVELSTSVCCGWRVCSIDGGVLVQTDDLKTAAPTEWTCVTHQQPSEQQQHDMILAWHAVRQVKSNAIVFVKDGMTLGIGTGQTSRVLSTRIAMLKAQEAALDLKGSVMASDAFFPFADGVEVALAQGVTTIIQPGGSKRDSQVIGSVNQAKAVMVFTGVRHFRH